MVNIKCNIANWLVEIKILYWYINYWMVMFHIYIAWLFLYRRRPTQHQKNLFKADIKKKVPKKKLPERDLPTKYFGEYLDPNEVFHFKYDKHSKWTGLLHNIMYDKPSKHTFHTITSLWIPRFHCNYSYQCGLLLWT